MALRLTGILVEEKDNRWKGICKEIPYVVRHGESAAKAAVNLKNAIRQYFEYLAERGELKDTLKKLGLKMKRKEEEFTLLIQVREKEED